MVIRDSTASLRVLYWGIVILSVVNWYAIGDGLHALAGGAMPLLIAFFIAFVIQSLLAVAALHVLPGASKWYVWPLWVVVYLVTVTLSVIFAISFYFSIFSAESYGESVFEEHHLQAMEDATRLHAAHLKLREKFADLAAYSKERSQVESRVGGTCAAQKGGGAGPYTHKRRYQAARFGELAGEYDATSQKLDTLIGKMQALRARKDQGIGARLSVLRTLFADLKAQYRDSVESGYTAELNNFVRYEMEGFPRAPQFAHFAGPDNRCGDQVTVAKIEGVLGVRMPPTPPYDIEAFDPADGRQVVNKVVRGIAGLFTPAKAGAQPRAGGTIFSEQYLFPIGAGLFVDLLILIGGVMIQLSQGERRSDSKGLDRLGDFYRHVYPLLFDYREFAPDLPSPKAATVGYAAGLLRTVLRRAAVETGGEAYLFLPLEHEGDVQIRTTKGHRLVELLHEIHRLLKVGGYLGVSLGEHTEFKGYTLDNVKSVYGLSDADIGINGKFQVWRLDPAMDEFIGRYAASPDEFVRHREGMRWYHYLGAPNRRYDDILGMVMERDDRVVAAHLLTRLRRHSGAWRLILFNTNAGDRAAIVKLREWLGALGTGAREVEWGKVLRNLPLPFYVFYLGEEGVKRLSDMAASPKVGT